MIRRLNTDERGFTLMEMLVSLAVGSMLLLAIFGALDYSVTANGKVQDRVDSAQRGRAAMELITQQLRSQICLGPGYPAIPVTPSSDGSSITFFTDLGGDTGAGGSNGSGGAGKLQRRTITYSSGTVYETDFSVGGTIPTAPTFTLVRSNWVLADHLTQAIDPVTSLPIPFFRYFAFTPTPVLPNKWLNKTAPSYTLADVDKPSVVQVSIAFIANPLRGPGVQGTKNKSLSTFQNDVYVRTSDASDPDHSPQCI
jgi:prepilin-type N-terminal cleavage/methylation domain-containing protein